MDARIVYCYCYDHNRATGGQKDTYKHVDVLNSLGIEAYVLHEADGFRLTWFANQTPVIGMKQFSERYRPYHDVLVLPEDLGERILSFSGHKVIFDKNLYYGFSVLGDFPRLHYPALDKDVVALLTVSEHNQEHLAFAYPSATVFRILPEINTELFRWRPFAQKKLQFVFPRKSQRQIRALVHILAARRSVGLNKTDNSMWVLADGLSEVQMANLLEESLGLIFLSTEEGLGLLPLEAIACGCVVATFGVGPLSETMPKAYQFEYGNLVSIALFIESVVASHPNDSSAVQILADAGRSRLAKFSRFEHVESIKAAWSQILKKMDSDERADLTPIRL